ncbi:hypothetical protein [Amycolatopsis suaedae]|uniref:Uncharacterized protein n=1 Tax=Amycolatopsis suaedae TaxID=2510978 RepID=A0A4Q7IWI3_9PSEU|nr:hypothetical protein [Amycolatopsis suaedae]RZQ59281.1 hypothetical protein EWH70_34970 [Amycolatopsis suaedae]
MKIFTMKDNPGTGLSTAAARMRDRQGFGASGELHARNAFVACGERVFEGTAVAGVAGLDTLQVRDGVPALYAPTFKPVQIPVHVPSSPSERSP